MRKVLHALVRFALPYVVVALIPLIAVFYLRDAIAEQYEAHHRARLGNKPGLTGMWQVSGRSSITDFDEVVKLDLEYIDNWSVGLDIKILFMTVYTVLFRRGAV